MAHVWQYNDHDPRWTCIQLQEAACLSGGDVATLSRSCAQERSAGVLLYCTSLLDSPARWSLIAPPSARVKVNGEDLQPGIRVLADRDAIRLPGQRPLYFSTESLARIVSFQGGPDTFCVRCKLAIEPESPAVECPACGVFYHEDGDSNRLCWTYSSTCGLCDQDTNLDSPQFRWTPEGL